MVWCWIDMQGRRLDAIYKYKCENVHVFEVMQKLFDDPCPRVSSAALRSGRLCNGEHLVQGSGFYATDHRAVRKPKRPPRTASRAKRAPRKRGLPSRRLAANRTDEVVPSVDEPNREQPVGRIVRVSSGRS
jgi:predicted nucleic acid-binding Zn ribbon protein